MPTDWESLARALVARFEGSSTDAWTDDEFEAVALEVFAFQFEGCAPYRALCERSGRTPGAVRCWQDVPPVPATAFKYFDFSSAPTRSDGRGAVFRTSGTTRGEERRGRHLVPDLELYRAALLGPFRSALLPDEARLPFLSLIPDPAEARTSSLSHMVGLAAERLAEETLWLVDVQGQWRPEALDRAASIVEDGRSVLVLGTALSFLHAIDGASRPLPALPEGSRIMETGGFKGVRRAVSRAELYGRMSTCFGVPEERIVNEYGMTELLSQLYEPVLTEGPGAQGWHLPAPWLRLRALDPSTLEPVPDGTEGVLAFFDLANAGSVAHVLTEDVGVLEGGRLRLLGRAPGSEPRGCSRAMDELLAANRVVRP